MGNGGIEGAVGNGGIEGGGAEKWREKLRWSPVLAGSGSAEARVVAAGVEVGRRRGCRWAAEASGDGWIRLFTAQKKPEQPTNKNRSKA